MLWKTFEDDPIVKLSSDQKTCDIPFYWLDNNGDPYNGLLFIVISDPYITGYIM